MIYVTPKRKVRIDDNSDGQHGQHGIEVLALSIKSKRLAIPFERETEPLLKVHRYQLGLHGRAVKSPIIHIVA